MRYVYGGVLAALLLSSLATPAVAEHHPSQKHLKRSVCLAQCAADIAAHCVPHHHFHQCRGTLIRQCQHRKPGVCVTTTTTSTTTTLPTGGSVLKGALAPTLGKFNYNGALGLPGALAACQTSFGTSTHVCTYTELQSAAAAGDLKGLKDTASTPVTS